MPSLFRIDRSYVNNDNSHVVRLPGLEEMLAINHEDIEALVPEADEFSEKSEDSGEDGANELDIEYGKRLSEIEELRLEAERIREEMQQTIDAAQAECDELRMQARREGYEQARKDAELAVADERETEKRAFENLCRSVRKSAEQHKREAEDGILQVALTVARRILKIEFDRNDEVFLQIVRDTSELLHRDIKKTIHISESDYERFFAGNGEAVLHDLEGTNTVVVADSSLRDGDCLMTSEFGTINTGVKSQFAQIEEGLKEA